MKTMQVLKNKKGFTLIEIIVVLIILAILAAAGIPGMLGFIEDSRGKAYVAEARVGMVAAQVILTEDNGVRTRLSDTELASATGRFKELTAGITGTYTAVTYVDSSSNQVTGITYTSGNTTGQKYKVTISPAGTKVEKAT